MSLTRPMFRLTLLSTLITATTVSFAAESMPETTLDSLTVTATRSPTLVQNTIAQTTVIDEADLQRYQGQSVLDVLQSQPGLIVTQSGGDGTLSNFYIRGFDSKQILVLIDGVRYSSATTGSAALNLIPTDQIDRIEVLHGASGSSLYGADAMGGVIQIFTKGHNAAQSNVAVTIGAGSQDSYKGQITGQLVNESTTVSLSAGYEETDGIDATRPYAQFNAHHPDKDGFESKNASLFLKHSFNENIDAGLTGLFAESTTEYDSSQYNYILEKSFPYSKTYSDQKNGAVSGFLNYKKDKLSANVKYGQSFDNLISYDGNSPTGGQFDTTQQQANLQLGYQLPIGQVIAGYEHLKQEIDSTTAYPVDSRTIKSVYAGYLLNNYKFDAQLNVRNDDNSQFGNETTFNIGGAYRILPNLRVGASYATGFVAPSFNFLYHPYGSNPNLKAETSKNSEIFVEHSNNLQKTRLTVYRSDVKDKIKNDINYIPQNIAEAKIEGVSLTSDWTVNNVLFGLGYDYQDTEDQNGKELSNHPNYQGLAYIGYQQPTFDIRTEVKTVGDTALKGYTLLNVSGNYYVSPNLTISSRLNNLTGKEYETTYGYNQKGINAFVSATYKWF